ncbi:alpha-glucosidase [Pseudomaricurvus alkylphenolicus]|uniref:alpha-glucosidase family protein n=1 Tax=Pseudomaricurvus alkylphenolicus TaxID=1306991 RepID=UPI00141D8291|nr:alpha-glucosidase family protein [Pseudomaricurvus alkylphenolicus]NIB39600.1 alpha-glucosidase [Pseudomaricurvus alkylphenolicus]
MVQDNWWQGAVIYQVYPRSLYDTNGDGIGDIAGIIEKMDYIASLGVDAIWVSPFFKSPMKDFGYDISDYRDIDPIFGTLKDFDDLIECAHSAGVKVIIDQVLSHTSDQHAWFQESRQSRDNDKSDWYVWADANEDGGPPNNWLSIFGGGAWQWEPRRGQYFLHNFLDSQPDLNYHNPDVQQQMLEEVEFWLKRGVDGLRLDAINFCFHDAQLRDNPPKPPQERQGRGFSEDNPYAFQYHYYNNTQPENLAFLERLRQRLNRYPGAVALGEISSEDSLATMAEYTEGDHRLHTAYSFELLVDDFSADYIRSTVETLERRMEGGWPCWAVGNHDVARVMSRWGNGQHSEQLPKMINAMLGSLRGAVCSYQGEELGLPEAEIPFEQLQDPYGIAFWPNFKGRDGCRTPLPWQSGETNGGFGTTAPWLPVPQSHREIAVDVQDSQPDSTLNHYRQFQRWRKQQIALRLGDIEFMDSADNVLMFLRRHPEQQVLACFNFNNSAIRVELPAAVKSMTGHGGYELTVENAGVQLPPFGIFFGTL